MVEERAVLRVKHGSAEIPQQQCGDNPGRNDQPKLYFCGGWGDGSGRRDGLGNVANSLAIFFRQQSSSSDIQEPKMSIQGG